MTLRSICSLALPLLALTFTRSAHAQTSVYGSLMYNDYVLFLNGQSNNSNRTGGLIGGGFYNFPIQSRLTAGIDGRFAYGVGKRGGTAGIGALRVAFVPHQVPLRPYFELGGGVVSATFIDPLSVRYTSGGLALIGGLDVRLTDSLDVRAFELGALAGGSTRSVGTAFLDAGIVYHFQPRHP